MEKNDLKYLKHGEIDYEKWNQCIGEAQNARIYATTWLLDRTAEIWDAMVWKDYEFVMPLPVGRKWGIKYIYQPFFCQQLGIFPAPPVDIQSQFADELIKRFRFFQFQVNPLMTPDAFKKFEVTPKINYVLPLLEPYATIASQFKRNARYHIANAYKKGIQVVNALDTGKYVEMKKQQVAGDVSSKSFKMLAKIISWGQTNGNGQILAAITPGNEVCAAGFFLQYGNRLVYLNSFSTSEGRKLRAMYAILNEVIRKYAKSGLLLDFEGSSVEGIATFFRSFNPAEEFYYHLYLNNLPFPLKYLKKNKT